MTRSAFFERSAGVIHGMSPSHSSATPDFGVDPPTTSAMSESRTRANDADACVARNADRTMSSRSTTRLSARRRKVCASSRMEAIRRCSGRGGRRMTTRETMAFEISLKVAPTPSRCSAALFETSHQKRYFSSRRLLSGMKLLKPWLVAMGTVLMATCPIGARELKSTELAGNTLAAQLRSPSVVNLRGVSEMYTPFRLVRSAGVTHGTSPPQNSGSPVFGVAPPTTSQTSSSATRSQLNADSADSRRGRPWPRRSRPRGPAARR